MKAVIMFVLGMVAGMSLMYWGYQHGSGVNKFFVENWWMPQHMPTTHSIVVYKPVRVL